MFENAINKMAGSSKKENNPYDRLEHLYEMERLGENYIELYLKWFSNNKLVYFDDREGFLNFLSILEDRGDIGIATQSVLTTKYDTEFMGYNPIYFGRSEIDGGVKYLLAYPCTMSGEEISFAFLDADYGIATFVLDMDKPVNSDVMAVRYNWSENSYTADRILR